MTLRLQSQNIHQPDSRTPYAGRTLDPTYQTLAGTVVQQARAVVATAVISSLLFLNVGAAFAQDGPSQGPPAAAYVRLYAPELGQLVAPIALYPDALVAQILAASTYGPQVVEAESFVRRNAGAPAEELARIVDVQPWDPSVKALTAFPAVLSNLSTNYTWTNRLGDAYFNQPQDVMAAVQSMRQRAYAAGTLRPSPQENVVYQAGNIVIVPVNPTVVYVPVYNPWVVYGAPIPVYAAYVAPPPPSTGAIVTAAAIGFTAGVLVGAFSNYGWGCSHWTTNWYSHTVVYNRSVYVSHGYYGGGYRGGYAGGYRGGYAGGSGYRSGYAYNGYRGGSYTSNTTAGRSGNGQVYGQNVRTATSPSGASATATRTYQNGQYTDNKSATSASGKSVSSDKTASVNGNGHLVTSDTVTGAKGGGANATTTHTRFGSKTTVTDSHGKSATILRPR